MEYEGSVWSLVPILSHLNPFHTLTTYLRKMHFNIALSHMWLDLPSGLFTSGFPIEIV
jgi:hypothetical protein